MFAAVGQLHQIICYTLYANYIPLRNISVLLGVNTLDLL